MITQTTSPRSGRPAGALLFLLFLYAAASAAPVTIKDQGENYLLSNGILSARIDKRSGVLTSLTYTNIETISGQAYWSPSAASPQTIDAITVDPRTNDGQRGEVAVQ